MVAERVPAADAEGEECTQLALIPLPPALPVLSPDERDQVLEVAQMVAEETDRLHQMALVTRIRAAAHRAVEELGEMRQKASLPDLQMWKVEQAGTNAKSAAKEVEQFVRSYDALMRRIAKSHGQQGSGEEQGR